MASYIMERSLLLICLLAFIDSGNSLRCYSCDGIQECNQEEVTCTGENDRCSTSVFSASSFFFSDHHITKTCSSAAGPSKYTMLSTDRLVDMSLQEMFCNTDLCNDQKNFDVEPYVNGLNCHGCISPGKECRSNLRTQLQCTGDQNQCVDIGVQGTFGDMADISLKGCGQITACSGNLHFISNSSSVRVQCCDGNFCNDLPEMAEQDTQPNGLECHSCNTVDGNGCSPEEVGTVKCYGPLTSCLEIAGLRIQNGKPMPHVIKGCATPAMCNSSVLTLLQKMNGATVQCCDGSLCNNKLTEASVKTDDIIPPYKVSSNLECFICEGSYENGCRNQTLETCDEAMTICSEIITVIKAGNQSVSMIQKSCGLDSATTNTSKKNYEGLTILSTKRGCNSSKCNNATSPLPQDPAKPDSPAADAVECYSCINTNQTLCLPEKVKCPKDKNNCYDGVASVVQGGFEQTIFVKQCSNGSSHELFQHKWLNISLNSTFCSGNLCNDQPETTTIPSTKTPKVNSTTIIMATTNGVSLVARYSSALLYLPILLLSMLS